MRWLVAIAPYGVSVRLFRSMAAPPRVVRDVALGRLAQFTACEPGRAELLYAWPWPGAPRFTFSGGAPSLGHFLVAAQVEPAIVSALDNSGNSEHVVTCAVEDDVFALLELSLEGDPRARVSQELLRRLDAGQTKGGVPPR